MTRRITLAQLRQHLSCNHDRILFEKYFGEGGEVTVEKVMAHAQEFDWLTAAKMLLTPKQKQYFKLLVLNASRGLRRITDPQQTQRRKALAMAFYRAYMSPE